MADRNKRLYWKHGLVGDIFNKKEGILMRFPDRYINIRDIGCNPYLWCISKAEEAVWSRLHRSAFKGLEDVCLEQLTMSTYDLNRTTESGNTPLHLACVRANYSCIEAILGFKPEMNIQNNMLYTPLNLFVARLPRNDTILKNLLDAGANPNVPDEDGFSPLHTLAIQAETYKTKFFARLLVQYKANIHSENHYKETPLHIAVFEGRISLVEFLIDSGASVNIPDMNGRTPMDIALGDEYEYSAIYDLLARHLIIQNCCGDAVNLQHLEKVCYDEEYRIFKKCCEEEKQKLKITFAGESAVTFENILLSSTHKVAKYLLNSDIVMSLEKFNMKEGVLGPILMKKYEEALELCNEIKLGIAAINKLFPFLPHPCVDKLTEYLNNEDFNNIHKAYFS